MSLFDSSSLSLGKSILFSMFRYSNLLLSTINFTLPSLTTPYVLLLISSINRKNMMWNRSSIIVIANAKRSTLLNGEVILPMKTLGNRFPICAMLVTWF
jgi:hypothetical protein